MHFTYAPAHIPMSGKLNSLAVVKHDAVNEMCESQE